MLKRFGLFACSILALVGPSFGSECLTPPPALNESVLPALALNKSAAPAWARSDRNDFPREFTEKFSTFYWASNAAILAGSVDGEDARTKELTDRLLGMLNAHTEVRDDGHYIAHDYPHNFHGFKFEPPWYSALANGFVAVGLMHLAELTGEPSLNNLALEYLKPIPTTLSHRDDEGHLWFEEYVAKEMPQKSGVVNGHFAALGALQEWRIRFDDCRFDTAILEGLKTLEYWLPRMAPEGQEYFGYSRHDPTHKDYGQERAVIQANAACRISGRTDLCNAAKRHNDLYNEWSKP